MFKSDAEIIRIVGWREWAIVSIHWPAIRDWFLRVWFCHHHARLLVDMEYRLGCVLGATTRGMSQAYYRWEIMAAAIDAQKAELCNDAIKEFKEEYDCHCDEAE